VGCESDTRPPSQPHRPGLGETWFSFAQRGGVSLPDRTRSKRHRAPAAGGAASTPARTRADPLPSSAGKYSVLQPHQSGISRVSGGGHQPSRWRSPARKRIGATSRPQVQQASVGRRRPWASSQMGGCHLGPYSTASRARRGKVSLSSSMRFPAMSREMQVMPVRFPPGRARLRSGPRRRHRTRSSRWAPCWWRPSRP
jgi:hypothetical protein